MIAITGATGHLGTMIISNLLKSINANEIVAIVRSPVKTAKLVNKGIILRTGGYEDKNSLIAAFKGIDVLMFISLTDIEQRLKHHRNIIEAAQSAGIKRLVYTSFINIDGQDVIAQQHRYTEKLIKNSGIVFTILRPSLYMDSYIFEIEIAMEKGVYRSTLGESGVAFISRQDIARCAATTLLNENHVGKTYTLTGPRVVTGHDFADVATKLSGKKVIYQKIFLNSLIEDYIERGMPQMIAEMSAGIETIIAANELALISNDVELITGQPAMDFETFMFQAFGK
jgi:NAD(P)H dehydrogenase (quinone)